MRPKNAGPLTPDDIRMIRRGARNKTPRAEMAKDFNVSKQTIDRILWGHTYAWVLDNPEDELEAMEKVDAITEMEADESARKVLQMTGGRE